jgi:RNA polymerase sigma factor (sigma-70 family)
MSDDRQQANQLKIGIDETMLESLDRYIVMQAKKLLYRSHASSYRYIDLEVDELAQRVRIKLWNMLKKGPIHRPYPYVRRIIYSEFIDIKRQRKPLLSLNIEEEGDHQPQTARDPADEIMQEMEDVALQQRIVHMVVELPPRQQLAMICFLRDVVDDPAQLSLAFCKYHIDITDMQWPRQKAERQLLRASLTVARHKLIRRWLMTARSSSI